MIACASQLASLLAPSMRRWRRYSRLEDCRKQFVEREGDEIDDLARRTGMSADDLRTLAKLGIHGASPLRSRMLVLRLDPDRFADAEPAALRELQIRCSRCRDHARCIKDLARDAIDPTRPDWRDYCPNAAWLNTLCALRLIQ